MHPHPTMTNKWIFWIPILNHIFLNNTTRTAVQDAREMCRTQPGRRIDGARLFLIQRQSLFNLIPQLYSAVEKLFLIGTTGQSVWRSAMYRLQA